MVRGAFPQAERGVASILGTSQDVVLMQGECMLGLEAAARSLVRPGMSCLNLVSGICRRGMGLWLRSFGADVIEIEVPFSAAIDPADVARAFDEHATIELVTVVHSETPCGTLNPVEEIGPIAKEHGALTLVDAASTRAGCRCVPTSGSWTCVSAHRKSAWAHPRESRS